MARDGAAASCLLAGGHAVTGFDRAPASTTERAAVLGDDAALRAALAGPDAVVHTSAQHAPHIGVLSDVDLQRINVEGTRMVLDAVTAAGVRRIVLTSTTALYGAAAEDIQAAAFIDEDTIPEPQTICQHTKREAEAVLRAAAVQAGPALRGLRSTACTTPRAPSADSAGAHGMASRPCWRPGMRARRPCCRLRAG